MGQIRDRVSASYLKTQQSQVVESTSSYRRIGYKVVNQRDNSIPISLSVIHILTHNLNLKTMEFKEALRILDIEDYGERIFNSNSHGELFHLEQYIILAKINPPKFREWFVSVVKFAEKNWERPESVFQHIIRIFKENIISSQSKT